MERKLRRINDDISADHLVSIRLPFKPVRIPVDENLKFDETQQRWVFSSLVWLNEEKDWGIFEFDKEVMNILAAYAMRNHGMQHLEILVSRHADSTIKLNAGFDKMEPIETLIGDKQFGVMKDLADRILDRYRKTSDIVLKI